MLEKDALSVSIKRKRRQGFTPGAFLFYSKMDGASMRQHAKLRPAVLRMQGFRAVHAVSAVVHELGFAVAVVLQAGALDASGHEVVDHRFGAAFRQLEVKLVGRAGVGV